MSRVGLGLGLGFGNIQVGNLWLDSCTHGFVYKCEGECHGGLGEMAPDFYKHQME